MIALWKLCLIIAAGFILADSECPEMKEIQRKFNETHLLCAQTYPGEGDENPQKSCKNCSDYETPHKIYDGAESDPKKFYFPMGSIIVMPNCTLSFVKSSVFSGDEKIFKGPIIVSKKTYGSASGECANGPDSYICQCSKD